MDLTKYQELTGNTVSEADKARVNATIRKANSLLESELGYSLSSSKNIDKTEIGKVQFQGAYPYYPANLDNLLPPDEAEGDYRLFYYNDKDPYIKCDPARNIYHVKLVRAINDDEFVTIFDLDDFTPKNYRKFAKYIERSTSWFNWDWYIWLTEQIGNGNGLMVAIDADWMDCSNMPDDIGYVWSDMIDYYSNPDYSVSGSLKSESVNGHSWSRASAGGGSNVDLSPERSDAGISILSQYAGPNGRLASRNPA